MGATTCKPCCNADDPKKVATITQDTSPLDEFAQSAAVAAESFVPHLAESAAPGDGRGAARDGVDVEMGPSTPRESGGEQKPKPGMPPTLMMKINRNPDMNIGLNLDALDGSTAYVDNIIPGAVQGWNTGRPEKECLKISDRIVAVNGVQGDTDKLLSELKATTTWNIAVLRPFEMRVVVDCKRFPSLGLDLKYSPNGNTLLISDLGDGAIKEWNTGPQDLKVARFDRIVAINGVRGSAKSLLEAAASVEVLDLVILHYDSKPNS